MFFLRYWLSKDTNSILIFFKILVVEHLNLYIGLYLLALIVLYSVELI